jgi:hypothetical protein
VQKMVNRTTSSCSRYSFLFLLFSMCPCPQYKGWGLECLSKIKLISTKTLIWFLLLCGHVNKLIT